MKTFEIFSESHKKGQNGRRKFKAILYRIFPDDCIDEESESGTQYNANGITWIRKYCEAALPSIRGMSLKCEFLDEDRTEMAGHGMTDTVDSVPIFEDATVIGTFTGGYIADVELPDGTTITACIGEGEIDSSCYHNLVTKLDEEIENGIYPSGSVEIMRTEENKGIKYLYGYKEKGRIPTEFIHSGYALLGVTPSDKNARLLELNNKMEESTKMNHDEMNELVGQVIETYTNHVAEINQAKNDCETKIAELNEVLESERANSTKIQEALDACQKERDEAYQKLDGLYEEMRVLREELGKAKAKERIGELNAAIADFTAEEQAYADAEIKAFHEDPVNCEINSVVDKILIEIGKNAKKADAEHIVTEQNSAKYIDVEDIFAPVETGKHPAEDVNIF